MPPLQPPSSHAAALPQRVLGATGIRTPALGVGCWAIGGPATNLGLPMGWDSGADTDSARDGLMQAYTLGARLFDTADVYGLGRSERLIGELVAEVGREQLVLVSKVGYFPGTAAHGYSPGHMRRQLEQSLENLSTDHLDVYFLHHNDFGPDDRYLNDAVEQMRTFKRDGLVRAIGMRGPHLHALERLDPNRPPGQAAPRFADLIDRVAPDVLAVRDNLLTPAVRSSRIYRMAAERGIGILINKPLAQGLLTGTHHPHAPRVFGDADHRRRKRWFTPNALELIQRGLDDVRTVIGPDPAELVRFALWHCLKASDQAIALCGFTSPAQVRTNLTCLAREPDPAALEQVRRIMADTQQRLDAQGAVFRDAPAPAAETR
ncbi:aldo/keto reductase [Salinactinospora qingdaonensis]|uniref:NADH-dependent methylglyoxal reductase n=1 Tax=Salinactinospora qingdaonensis TaxID=702744 RepID=A0ABP7GJ41_9ACTN